ncbi:MAG: lysostaphin resistance A-like protein [Planctomycetota bacterium]|jgi:membrane protease YdiL (CAAX protease family)
MDMIPREETPGNPAPSSMPPFDRPRSWLGRPHPLLAWIVIVAMAGLTIMAHQAAPAPGTSPIDESGTTVVDRLFGVQNRVFVAVGEKDTPRNRRLAFANAAPYGSGSLSRRAILVVLAHELDGPEQVLTQLDLLELELATARSEGEGGEQADDGDAAAEDEAAERDPVDAANRAAQVERIGALHEVLRALYVGGEPDVVRLTASQRDALIDELGWYGELALVPAGQDDAARNELLAPWAMAAVVFGILVIVAVGAACIGGIGLLVMLGAAFTNKLRGGLPSRSSSSGYYAETFAAWLVLFLCLQAAAGLVGGFVHRDSALLLGFIGFMLSLSALAWPVLRGVPWATVRADIGLNLGRRPLLEPFIGVGCYLMGLPIIVVGVLITFGLMWLTGGGADGGGTGAFGGEDAPSHPVIDVLAQGGWWPILQVYLVASVAAPIVEEIAFRGLLYRHLRDASRMIGTVGSIIISTLLGAFVFAAIHPQGLLAIPALMSVAVGMTLTREWRGSLIPSMVIHAVNNGIIMTLMVVALGV